MLPFRTEALPWRDLPEDGLALQRVPLHGAGAGEPVVVHAVLVHELLPICHLAVGKQTIRRLKMSLTAHVHVTLHFH